MSAPRWRQYLRLARPNVVADVDDELTFHLEMRVAEYVRRGMSHGEAEREARTRFGDVAPIREVLVDHDRMKQTRADRREYFGDLWQDVRFGLRSLKRAPGFAAAAIATLAIGIGANTAIFSVVDALLLRPLPYPRSQELVSIGLGSAGEFLALRERLRTFSDIAAWSPRQLSVDDGQNAFRLEGAAITTNLLRTLNVSPAFGAGFEERHAIPGNSDVVILSHRFWQRQFGGDRTVVGRRLSIEGIPHTILAVMGSDFHYPTDAAEYWIPIAFNPKNVGPTWAVFGGRFIGRVKPGATVEQALGDVRATWPTMRRLNPLWDPGEAYGKDANPEPLRNVMVGAPRSLLFMLVACVMLVLLIACVNVANLLLARANARERELAVRAAVGGGRARLVRQLVTESMLLSTIGAIAGVALAFGAVRWLVAMLPAGIPRASEIGINGTVLVVTGAVALLTGLLFGVAPALRITSAAQGQLSVASRRTTQGAQQHRLSAILVGAEVALAVLLVICAQLLVRSFNELRRVETGFSPSRVIAARVSPPGAQYGEDKSERILSFYDAVLDRMRTLPGVTQVGTVDQLPMVRGVYGIAPRVEGLYEDASKVLPDIHNFQSVSPGYFGTMGIRLLHGRGFERGDVSGAAPVAIVSEGTARKYWPNESAIGKRVGYPWPSPWITVVGVVADIRQDSLRDTLTTAMYVPAAQRTRMSGAQMWVVARTTGDARALATEIRAIVRETDRTVAVSDVRTMEDIIDGSVQRDRFAVVIVGLFALMALVLGAVGIYGVMSYLVSQRTREMGVRIALGASTGAVLGLVVRRGIMMAGIGAAVGVIAALWATRPLAALLYGISATDPLTFATVPIVFLFVAIAASYSPARRATKVDPIRALRAD